MNTLKKDERNNKIYDYPELNGYIKSLKTIVKEYYLDEIVSNLFKYKFLV